MYDLLIIISKLLLAIILGGFIGIERETLGKPAGARTYALVTIASTLLTILSVEGLKSPVIAGQIIVGVGFIGAGLIFVHRQHIEGLTTAAGLLASATLGIAIGVGWYLVAVIASLLIFLLLFIVRKIEFEHNKKKTLWSLFEKK
jgi:putative Mg2+ transporter-C (MgtC) family protein